MKENKKNFFVGVTVGFLTLGIMSFSLYSTFAKNRFFGNGGNEDAKNAVLEGDYEAFKSAVSDNDDSTTTKAESISEETFLKMHNRSSVHEKMKSAIESGDYEAFKSALLDLQQLNIPTEEKFSEMHEKALKRLALKEAIENKDYDAFVKASEGMPCAEKITEENFSKVVEMQNAVESGDMELAKKIADELGIHLFSLGRSGFGGARFGGGKKILRNFNFSKINK